MVGDETGVSRFELPVAKEPETNERPGQVSQQSKGVDIRVRGDNHRGESSQPGDLVNSATSFVLSIACVRDLGEALVRTYVVLTCLHSVLPHVFATQPRNRCPKNRISIRRDR